MHCLTPGQVAAELAGAGFGEPAVFGDVAGSPYAEESPGFAVLTRLVGPSGPPSAHP